MGERRRLTGKKLLVASLGLGAASTFTGCGDAAVANLVAPPDAAEDAPADAPPEDAPVANLVLPPDSGSDAANDAANDAESDAAEDAPSDAAADSSDDAS